MSEDELGLDTSAPPLKRSRKRAQRVRDVCDRNVQKRSHLLRLKMYLYLARENSRFVYEVDQI